jgi:signal transduction histidine kinase
VLGRSMRTQKAQARVLAAQFAERAVAAERARFARELHDVVAHHVSVVVVQAAGAHAALDDDPAAARVALRHIESSGREA